MSLLLLALALVPGCAHTPQEEHDLPILNTQAVAGVADPALAQLLSDHWELTMRRSPEWASRLGDHRYDDQLGDRSPAAYDEDLAQIAVFVDRARSLNRDALSAADHLTLDLFLADLRGAEGEAGCRMERWAVSAMDTPVGTVSRLAELTELPDPEAGARLLARYQAVPAQVDGVIANLTLGETSGLYAQRGSVERTIALMDRAIAEPTEETTLYKRAAALSAAWPQHDAFVSDAKLIYENQIRPSYVRFRDHLRDSVLPHTRADDAVGLSALPGGRACYVRLIERHTTLPLSAEALHQTGQDELVRIHAELRTLGKKVLGTDDLPTILARLRGDPTLYFSSADEVEQKARDAVAAAEAALPRAFGHLPAEHVGVKRIPDYEAPFTTIGYYQPGVPGEQAGAYYVNTYAPQTRPRYEAEVLAFHEAIPGHHLQIAIAMELGELPAFRRYGMFTAYVEGWALYSERLALELGLYSGDTDRLGMLSFDAWRASRLVVDTGLHAFGWSRGRAEQFLRDNTAAAENNIENEIDRYIVWPGQALAYKTGQLAILRLRAESEEKLGAQFSLSDFNDTVLGAGALTLPALQDRVRAWEATAGASSSGQRSSGQKSSAVQ